MNKPIIFQFKDLSNLKKIDAILGTCYYETGNKFSIDFLGSKGYLSHIEINAECDSQIDNNRLEYQIINEYKGAEKLHVRISFSEKKGVKVDLQFAEVLEYAVKNGLRKVSLKQAIDFFNESINKKINENF